MKIPEFRGLQLCKQFLVFTSQMLIMQKFISGAVTYASKEY